MKAVVYKGPFNVAGGFCKNCIAGYTGFCLTVNPGSAGGAYGYVQWGRVPADPGAPDDAARQGQLLVAVGNMFEKGLRMGTGRTNVKHYILQLRDLIIAGRAAPGS